MAESPQRPLSPSSEPTVEEILTEVDRRQQDRLAPRELSPTERRVVVGADRFIYWLARHWLAIFNIVALIYVGLPVLVPVLMEAGWERPARVIHTIYAPLCHQLPFRSFYLFGSQLTYTADELLQQVGPEALQQHGFIGNAEMGFKIALCQRDVAIYGVILVAGVLFGLSGRRWRPMPGWAYFLFGLVPIGLDGGLQLMYYFAVSTFPSLQLPSLESTPLRRVITGTLFGLATVWLAYPYVQATFEEIIAALEKRFGWQRS